MSAIAPLLGDKPTSNGLNLIRLDFSHTVNCESGKRMRRPGWPGRNVESVIE